MKFFLSMVFTILIISAAGCVADCNKSIDYIAHRGESFDAPENTLESVQLAWDRNDAFVEIDVHLTKDNKIVAIHDYSTKRVTNNKYSYKIADTNYSDLEKLDVGSWKGPEYKGVKIPLLSDILKSIPSGRNQKLVIEIKVHAEIVPFLKEEIIKSGKQSQIVVISFKLDSLQEFKKQMPEISVYFLEITPKDKETGKRTADPYDEKLIDIAVENGFEGLDLYYRGITKDFVSKAHAKGLKIWLYTVDDPEIAKQMIEYGVDGLTTNKAQWLEEYMSSGKCKK